MSQPLPTPRPVANKPGPPAPRPAAPNPAGAPLPQGASPMREQQRQLTYLLVGVLVVGVLILAVLVLIYFKPGATPAPAPASDSGPGSVASSASPSSTPAAAPSNTPPSSRAAATPPAPTNGETPKAAGGSGTPSNTGAAPARAADVSSGVGAPYIVAAGRSPIPQPGEEISKPIDLQRRDETRTSSSHAKKPDPSAGKSLFEAAKPDAPDRPVPWYEAGKYEGQSITVEGKVVDTRRGNKVVFLNFSRDRDSFYIIMFEKALDGWPDAPEKYLRDKTIRVTGKVMAYDKRMQIQVRNEYQVKVVE